MAPGSELERQLVSRVVAHDDHAAFARLVEMHQSPVRRFLRRLAGGDEARADDLAQEVFWKAYRNLRSYRGEGRLLSWLFTIAYQLFVSDERKRKGARFVELPELREESVPAGEARVEASRTVEQLLAALRPAERAAVLLHFGHQLSHSETANALGLPLGTVKSLVRRGRAKLQQLRDSARAGGSQWTTTAG